MSYPVSSLTVQYGFRLTCTLASRSNDTVWVLHICILNNSDIDLQRSVSIILSSLALSIRLILHLHPRLVPPVSR